MELSFLRNLFSLDMQKKCVFSQDKEKLYNF